MKGPLFFIFSFCLRLDPSLLKKKEHYDFEYLPSKKHRHGHSDSFNVKNTKHRYRFIFIKDLN
jgi:hypothetical protein